MSEDAVIVRNPTGAASVLLTCEHASAHVPPAFANLGLHPDRLGEHIGWDIGAGELTRQLSEALDAPAVLSGVTRLLVDCNRDLGDHDLIPAVSHGVPISGNTALGPAERRERLASYYAPYHDAVDRVLAARRYALLLSIHSFTPALNGAERRFDTGVLFDDFVATAHAFATALSGAGFTGRLNEPYSGFDGLIYSARSHGRRNGLTYLELEVNNRLLRDTAAARAVAHRVASAVRALLDEAPEAWR